LKANELALKVKDVYDKSDREIIATKYPIERSIRGFVVKDSVDVIVLKSNGPKKPKTLELYQLTTQLSKDTTVTFFDTLKALLSISMIRRDFSLDIPVKCIVLNTLNLQKKEITLEKKHRVNYPRIISSIVKSIENDVFYPRESKETCANCIFKNKCIWSID
jgi:CRISPR/Cas system-associated exonuclease Cas4 (RecB family)